MKKSKSENTHKKKKKKKIISLNYNKEQEEKYASPKTLEEFSTIPVPYTEHKRSLYLRDLSIIYEDTLQKGKGIAINIAKKISDNLKQYIYYGDNKKNMSVEHRMAFWIVKCRFDLVVHINSTTEIKKAEEGPIESWINLEYFDWIVSNNPVSTYTLKELITALEIMSEKISEIYYFGDIKKYLRSLYICCCRYLLLDTSDISKYDIKKYTHTFIQKDTTFYRISMDFIKDTETIFYEFERKIIVMESFTYTSIEKENKFQCPLRPVLKLAKKIYNDIQLTKYVLVPLITTAIFEYSVAPGERERYISCNLNKTVNGMNIVSFCRPEKTGFFNSLFEGDFFKEIFAILLNFDDYLKKDSISVNEEIFNLNFLEDDDEEEEQNYAKKKKKFIKKHKYNFIFEITSIILCEYIFENNNSSKLKFVDFILREEQIILPLIDNIFYHERLPMFVQVFSSWGVWDPRINAIHTYKTFMECFIVWLFLIHENHFKLRSLAVLNEGGINNLYEMLTHEKKRQQDMELEILLKDFPEHYTKETLMQFQ